MQVSKWGNDLAVRLPDAVVEALELKAGDEVEIRAVDARVLQVARKTGPAGTLEQLRGFRGRLPEDFVLDRDKAHER